MRISTRADERVQILFFVANPPTINIGQASQLSWRVLNATEVTISEIGQVAAQGTSSVSPQQTTTYRLTARNAVNEENATVTVVVNLPQTRVFGCFATPTNINSGEAATINYQTENATNVTVSPPVSGNIGTSGSFVVNPTQSTQYTITATGAGNQTSVCTVSVTVNTTPAAPPRIIRFTATPASIVSGQHSTLNWQVENADTVTIDNGVGTVALTGSQDVAPTQTTTYTLTATSRTGTSTAQVTVNVTQGVQITTFTANPPTSPAPGTNVTLTCLANNATSVTIAGAGALSPNGTVVVQPTVDTTYTCTAVGQGGTQDTRTLTVKVTQPGGGGGGGTPPVVVITGGPLIETVVRPNRLDASQSTSPAGATPLKYFWTSRNGRAAIDDPTSPTPMVYLGNLYGDYIFDLTVTDAKGNVSTGTVTVRLAVTRVP